MSLSFTVMHARSGEIGQPGSYLAQASFRKFVCVRGSVSSVLRCVRGRNEYRNNVSIGMTRRSFYLLNLRRISRRWARRERQWRRKKRGSGKKERRRGGGEMGNEERRRRRRRWRYDSSFSVYCQYSHRAALKTSKISIYLPEARKRERERETTSSFLALNSTPDVELRLNVKCVFYRFARPYICGMLRLEGTLANVLSGHPWFRIDDDANETGGTKKHRRLSWFEIPTFPGREYVGISKRTRLVASIELRISRHRLSCWWRRERMHVFHAFDKRRGSSDR